MPAAAPFGDIKDFNPKTKRDWLKANPRFLHVVKWRGLNIVQYCFVFGIIKYLETCGEELELIGEGVAPVGGVVLAGA